MSTIPSGIKTGWWSFELPQYRPHPEPSTYSLFSYEDLPPIHEKLDSGFQWLKSQPAKARSLTEGCYSDGSKPDLNKLSTIAAQPGIDVPKPFTAFIQSAELHERVRSCTDCYLDVADHAMKTKGITDGYLIFWLENEIWYALVWDKRPLTTIEQAYVNHYLKPAK